MLTGSLESNTPSLEPLSNSICPVDVPATGPDLRGGTGIALPTSKDQWAVLAGLRFLLALVVFATHSWLTVPSAISPPAYGATAAVIAFLMISGYSIAASAERGSPRSFYERRMTRIFPLALTVLLATLLVATFIGPVIHGLEFPSLSVFAGNLCMLQGFVVPVSPYNAPMWSLSIECFYYIFAPLLIRTSFRRILALVAISALAMIIHDYSHRPSLNFEMYGVGASCLAWSWLLGFLAYRCKRNALVTVLLLIVPTTLMGLEGQYGNGLLSGTTFAVTACAILFGNNIRLTASTAKMMNYLGELSYPLYISHFTVLLVLGRYVQFYLYYRGEVISLSACLLVAAILYHCIDVPIRKRRRSA